MKEVTRIITAQITTVAKIKEESDLISKEECMRKVKKSIECAIDVDNVNVIDVQDFIRDEDEPEQQEDWKDAVMQHFVKGD